jgi:replicative DNA helicase
MRGVYAPSIVQANDVVAATRELIKLPIAIDSDTHTPAQIDKVFQRAANAGAPIRLMVIDYLGLMQGDEKRSQSFDEFSGVSKSLKKLAIKHNATIFLLSQLNRQVSQYDKPDMRMLRETGSLEQDADRILFIWRDRADMSLVHFSVSKNRGGEIGDGVLRFDGSTMRFEEVGDIPKK